MPKPKEPANGGQWEMTTHCFPLIVAIWNTFLRTFQVDVKPPRTAARLELQVYRAPAQPHKLCWTKQMYLDIELENCEAVVAFANRRRQLAAVGRGSTMRASALLKKPMSNSPYINTGTG